MSDGKTALLAYFLYPSQAIAARLALEAEDIPCLVLDSSQAAMPGNPLFPIRMEVFEEDLAESKMILERDGIYNFQ
ncbi:hypothetical protein BH09SUM1_BH09SUM1_09140 [soil metagenome]